jgi:hypothetical protein
VEPGCELDTVVCLDRVDREGPLGSTRSRVQSSIAVNWKNFPRRPSGFGAPGWGKGW